MTALGVAAVVLTFSAGVSTGLGAGAPAGSEDRQVFGWVGVGLLVAAGVLGALARFLAGGG